MAAPVSADSVTLAVAWDRELLGVSLLGDLLSALAGTMAVGTIGVVVLLMAVCAEVVFWVETPVIRVLSKTLLEDSDEATARQQPCSMPVFM